MLGARSENLIVKYLFLRLFLIQQRYPSFVVQNFTLITLPRIRSELDVLLRSLNEVQELYVELQKLKAEQTYSNYLLLASLENTFADKLPQKS